MKPIFIKILGVFAVLPLIFSSCKKEGKNIFNMFDVTVDFHSNSPYSVTDYKIVNAQDSVYLEYTINSPTKDMEVVCIFENGSGAPFSKTTLKDSQRRSYSGVVKLKMSNKVGKTTYRIWALDGAGVYLGDGYKSVTVDVVPDYTYWAGRKLYVYGTRTPDKTFDSYKSEKSYFSVTTGESFSYNEGAANADKIDFGMSTTIDATKAGDDIFIISCYALSANYLKTDYPVDTWTDKGTLFSAPQANQSSAWLALRTSAQIIAAAKGKKPALKIVTGLKPGNLFYFLTKKGEYGAIYVNYFNSINGRINIGIDVKIK